MLTVSGKSWQSAVVMPLAMVTIEAHIDRTTLSSSSSLVMTGRMAFKIARAEAVACRHGEVLFVVVGNEYLRTIGFERAEMEADTAPLVYMLLFDE